MILFIIGIILTVISGILICYYPVRRKYYNTKEYQQYKLKQQSLKKTIEEKVQQLNDLHKTISSISQKITVLERQHNDKKKEIEEELKQKQNQIDSFYNNFKKISSEAFDNYEKILEESYTEKEKFVYNKLYSLKQEKEKYENQTNTAYGKLVQLKNLIEAVSSAQLKDQQEKEQRQFYQIKLNQQEKEDIIYLLKLKTNLHNLSIVPKIIWSSYILKPTSDMCNRVLQSSTPVCGIYKITNIETNQKYIGQSNDIANRWKTHIKYGLGIDTPSSNKLYNNMKEYFIWNYTFEVLEECPKKDLNEKERFWIKLYQSDKIGLNGTLGVKT